MSQILFKSNETKTRALTALVGVSALLLLLIPGGHIGATIVTAVLSLGMSLEFSKIIFRLSDANEKKIALLGTNWLIIFINIFLPYTLIECLMVSFVFLFTYFLITAEKHAASLKEHFQEFMNLIFVLVYVVMFMSFLPMIRKGPNGVNWLILFLLINWVGDSAAYFVGRKYGKNKLYPIISPNKTIEGSLGGLLGSLLVALIYKLLLFKDLGILPAILTALIVGLFSQVGDLCESMIKRAYGIKDSGQILPGHGGILDRFDGVLFTMPIMYLCTQFFHT